MCDCSDEVNISSIPVGPPGPTGPAGPGSILGGTSTDTETLGTGTVSFTLLEDTSFVVGQRVTAIPALDITKSMSGIITAYDTGTDIVEIEMDYVVGAGSYSEWTIAVAGDRGATGATGATGAAGAAGAAGATGATGSAAFSDLAGNGVSLGGSSWQLELTDSSFTSDGMVLYIEDAGYYQVTNATTGVANVINVDDLGYTGNNTANLLTGKQVTPSGLQGDPGTNGTDGFNYETTDSNNIPAEAAGSYEFLMRNSTDTGYTFVTLADLKVLLASIP